MPDHETQPHSELALFGEELRREREIRGISLKEISDATKISKRFLDAIERNDHKTLPAPVFTRGFVREYARYLGLNSEDMVNRYNYAAAGDDRIEQSAHLHSLVPERTEQRAKPKPIPSVFARVDRNVYITLVIVAALAALTVWAVRNRRALSTVDTQPANVVEPPAKPSPAVVAATTPPPQPPPSPADAETLKLTVEFHDDSWISLEADGKAIFADDGKRGETKTFEAKDGFKFRTIGNAAGVTLTLNDVRIPPLGPEGKVLHNRVFDRDYLRKAQEQPGDHT